LSRHFPFTSLKTISPNDISNFAKMTLNRLDKKINFFPDKATYERDSRQDMGYGGEKASVVISVSVYNDE
jgi:hypothetical protein